MTDIRTKQRIDLNSFIVVDVDWLLKPSGTLDEIQELCSAVVVALGSDRLAKEADILPDLDSMDRRGWWGDLDAEGIWNGWPIGTRLWLLQRAKIVGSEAQEGSTLARAELYAREALQPFLDNRVASRIDIKATRTDIERIEVAITIYRGPLPEIELRYQSLWNGIKEE